MDIINIEGKELIMTKYFFYFRLTRNMEKVYNLKFILTFTHILKEDQR